MKTTIPVKNNVAVNPNAKAATVPSGNISNEEAEKRNAEYLKIIRERSRK